MECKNAKREDGYYVLTRVYIPNGEFYLEPEWVEDVTSLVECGCVKCITRLQYEQMKHKTEVLLAKAKEIHDGHL